MAKKKSSREVESALRNHKDTVTSFESVDAQVQREIENLPEASRKSVREAQAIVQQEIDMFNDDLFSDEAFAASNNAKLAEKAGRNQPVGKIFKFNNYLLIKTPFNTTIPAQLYVDTLQDQIIGVTSELEKLKSENKELSNIALNTMDNLYNLTSFQLIKLAFSRLFRRT